MRQEAGVASLCCSTESLSLYALELERPRRVLVSLARESSKALYPDSIGRVGEAGSRVGAYLCGVPCHDVPLESG